MRETLPPIIEATFSLLPRLLAAQIMTQNTLLAQYYTALHNYCTDEGFPSPPPPMNDVIALWENSFKPVQQKVESSQRQNVIISNLMLILIGHFCLQLGYETGNSFYWQMPLLLLWGALLMYRSGVGWTIKSETPK